MTSGSAPAPAPTPIVVPEDLGALMRRARLAAGMTQAELAERLGLTRRYITEIESGKPGLYSQRLFTMMAELGVRLQGTVTPR